MNLDKCILSYNHHHHKVGDIPIMPQISCALCQSPPAFTHWTLATTTPLSVPTVCLFQNVT